MTDRQLQILLSVIIGCLTGVAMAQAAHGHTDTGVILLGVAMFVMIFRTALR